MEIDENTSIEDAFARLDEIIKKMEGTESTLEENLAFYKEGRALVEFCRSRVDLVEKELKVLEAGDPNGV